MKEHSEKSQKNNKKGIDVFILSVTLDGTRQTIVREKKLKDANILKALDQEELALLFKKEYKINSKSAIAYLVKGAPLYSTYSSTEGSIPEKEIEYHKEFEVWQNALHEISRKYPKYEDFKDAIVVTFLHAENTDESDKETADIVKKYKKIREKRSQKVHEGTNDVAEVDLIDIPWGVIRIQEKLFDILRENYRTVIDNAQPDEVNFIPSVNNSNGGFGNMWELEYMYDYKLTMPAAFNIMQILTKESRLYEGGATPAILFDDDPDFAISIRLALVEEKNRIDINKIIYPEPKDEPLEE